MTIKKEAGSAELKPYSFGSYEKIELEASDVDFSVFALMHGTDGCDPSKLVNDLTGNPCFVPSTY
jgi:hypothetical protein